MHASTFDAPRIENAKMGDRMKQVRIALALVFISSCGRSQLRVPDASTLVDARTREDSAIVDAPAFHPDVPAPLARQVAVGARHNCARMDDATVWCWGFNTRGQLGDGTRNERFEPRPVSGVAGAEQVVVGDTHSCARLRDRTVVCWGSADWGQGGDGDVSDRLTPRPVPGVDHVVDLVSGWNTLCAVRDDGSVWCWGSDTYRQLARPGNTEWCDALASSSFCGRRAQRVEGLPGEVISLASTRVRTCGLTRDSAVWCWGVTIREETGTEQCPITAQGANVPCTGMPVRVPLPAVRTIVTSSGWTCGIDAGGGVYCVNDLVIAAGTHADWMMDTDGSGLVFAHDGVLSFAESPTVPISGPPDPVQGSSFVGAGCVVDRAGAVWCTGLIGQLMRRVAF